MDRKRSKEINEYIKIHYKSKSAEVLAKELDISVCNVQKRASRMKIRKGTVANAIIDGKKLCCICGKFKDAQTEFRKDRNWQPNGVDYRCKDCRRKMERGEIEKESTIVLKNGRWAFHRKRTVNPMISGMIKCRGFCRKWKYADEFAIDRKMSHGHVNYCRECHHKLYEINKEYLKLLKKSQQEEG